MRNAKKTVAVVVAVATACLLSACGGGAGGGYGGSSYYSSDGSTSDGGGIAFGGCLEVFNDAESGRHALVLVQLRDPNTNELLHEEPVLVEPGEDVDLMDLPAGPYRVVGIFDDGLSDPFLGDPAYDRVIDPDVEAVITFRHP